MLPHASVCRSRASVNQLILSHCLLILLLTFTIIPVLRGQVPVLPVPPSSTFTPPPPNACQSKYDQFYIAEPGVYAYWALCEAGNNPGVFDYAGRFDLTPANNAWNSGPGTIQGGIPGPVPDGETG